MSSPSQFRDQLDQLRYPTNETSALAQLHYSTNEANASPNSTGGQYPVVSSDDFYLSHALCSNRSIDAFTRTSSLWLTIAEWWTNLDLYYMYNYYLHTKFTKNLKFFLNLMEVWTSEISDQFLQSDLELKFDFESSNVGLKVQSIKYYFCHVKFPYLGKTCKKRKIKSSSRSEQSPIDGVLHYFTYYVNCFIESFLSKLPFQRGEENIIFITIHLLCLVGYEGLVYLISSLFYLASISMLIMPMLPLSFLGTYLLVKVVKFLAEYFFFFIKHTTRAAILGLRRSRPVKKFSEQEPNNQNVFKESFGLYYCPSPIISFFNLPDTQEFLSVSKTDHYFENIFVKDDKTYSFKNIASNMSVADFIKIIRNRLSISNQEKILLNFNGKGLKTYLPLHEFNLQNNSTIFLSVIPVGGMKNADDEDYTPPLDQPETPDRPRVKLNPRKRTKSGSDQPRSKIQKDRPDFSSSSREKDLIKGTPSKIQDYNLNSPINLKNITPKPSEKQIKKNPTSESNLIQITEKGLGHTVPKIKELDFEKMTSKEIESTEQAMKDWLQKLEAKRRTESQNISEKTAPDLSSIISIEKPKISRTLPLKPTTIIPGSKKALINISEPTIASSKLISQDEKIYNMFVVDTPFKQATINRIPKEPFSSTLPVLEKPITPTTSTTTQHTSTIANNDDDPSESSSSASSNSSSEEDSNNESYSNESKDDDNDEDDEKDEDDESSENIKFREKKKKRKRTSSKNKSPESSEDSKFIFSAFDDFDVEDALEQVLGTEKDRAKFRNKIAKHDFKLPDVPVYTETTSFVEWWKLFRYSIQTCSIVGFVDQIEYLFHQLMEESIRKFIRNMNLKRKPTLEVMMRIVLSNYNTKPKSKWDYQELLDQISKKNNENVSAYYLRFHALADQAQNQNPEHLRVLFMKGLKPKPLWEKVNGKLKKNSTLKDAYRWAIHFEAKYLELQKYEENNAKRNENKNSSKGQEKKPNPVKQYENNSNDKKRNTTNLSKNPKENHGFRNNNNFKTTKGKPSGFCRYCGIDHDYTECRDKYPHYKPNEVKILLSLGKTPISRSAPPNKGREITKETEWVKRLLEEKKKNTPNNNANIQAVSTDTSPKDQERTPKSNYYQKNKEENSSNQQKESATIHSKK
jgi:hypothetical protein